MIGEVLSHPRVQVEDVGDRVQNAALAQNVRILAEEVEADQSRDQMPQMTRILRKRYQGAARACIALEIQCIHIPDDATAMIRLFKVRIRKAEKYFFELSLAKVIDQMLHRVRAQHRDVLKWRVAQSHRALLGTRSARGRRRRGDSVGAQINDSFLIESKQNGKTKANQMKNYF